MKNKRNGDLSEAVLKHVLKIFLYNIKRRLLGKKWSTAVLPCLFALRHYLLEGLKHYTLILKLNRLSYMFIFSCHFQRKHNIHCFYDHTQGQWMRLPTGWELHHEMVGKLVDQVEEALPTWGDRQDILALLRQCNYDPDECMSTYLYLEGDRKLSWLMCSRTNISGHFFF